MDGKRVIIVGAGISGLRCAQVLDRAGFSVTILERSDRVGGRITTDRVDGFLIDRGFQLLNPSYPQVNRALDPSALALQPFAPGMILSNGERFSHVVDPLRDPGGLIGDLRASLGSLQSRIRLLGLLAPLRFGGATKKQAVPDESTEAWFRGKKISDETIDAMLRPFLAGVLLENRLETSARVTALLLRSFLRGVPGVPAEGMATIPEQLAANLPTGTIRFATSVRSLDRHSVTLEDGTVMAADAVIVAVSGEHAHTLVPSVQKNAMRSTTTWWYSAPEPLNTGSTLVVDQSIATVVNSVEMTAAAPSYAPEGQVLVAASSNGLHPSVEAERAVRQRLSELHRTATTAWELISMSLIPNALPRSLPPFESRMTIEFDGVIVAGDHVATPSTQGAMASGERAALVAQARLA